MLYRHHQTTAQRAVIWLSAILFAVPVSFSAFCPCSCTCPSSVTAQRPICECGECPSFAFAADVGAGCHGIAPSTLLPSFSPCPCTDNCPCRCNHNSQRHNEYVSSRQDSQDDLDSGDVPSGPARFVGLNLHSLASSWSSPAAPASALQRCISLSRFTL